MSAEAGADGERWAAAWLDDVASGKLTMSQRKVTVIEARADMALVCRLARDRGVHLVQLTDDGGAELVAASRHPFKVLA